MHMLGSNTPPLFFPGLHYLLQQIMKDLDFPLILKMLWLNFQIVGEAKNGDLCGEIGVLCYRPQLFTVRTKRLSQLLRLNRTTFMNIIQANVGDGTIIMNNLLQVRPYASLTGRRFSILIENFRYKVLLGSLLHTLCHWLSLNCFWLSSLVAQHLKELKDPIMEGVLIETENMLARGRMDLPLSLCFATLRGDDLLLHHLLKRGLDPNESDNDGRTALVCIYYSHLTP